MTDFCLCAGLRGVGQFIAALVVADLAALLPTLLPAGPSAMNRVEGDSEWTAS